MEVIKNKQVSLALILIIVSKRVISNENREPPTVTDGFPCTDHTNSSNCINSNNSMVSPTTEALFTRTPEYDFIDFQLNVPNAEDIARRLKLPKTQEYLNSFTTPLQRLVVEGTLRHCPYLQLCNFSFDLIPNPFLGGQEPCCKACDCTPECLLNGLCCPDYPGIQLNSLFGSPSLTVEETCMNAYIRHHAAPGLKTDDKVKAYQTCPHNTDEHLNFRCSGQYELFSNITLDDVIPLSDNVTLKTYKNKYCAMCNDVNVEGLSKWKVTLGCQSVPVFSSESELLSLILGEVGQCDLILNPALNLDPEYCTSAITKCNVSGEWTESDRNIESACAGYETRITVMVDTTQVDYQNPFCAMCNGIWPSAEEFMCYMYYIPDDPGFPYSFSGLLRTQVANDQLSPEVKTCEEKAMFDEIKVRGHAFEVNPSMGQKYKLAFLNSSDAQTDLGP